MQLLYKKHTLLNEWIICKNYENSDFAAVTDGNTKKKKKFTYTITVLLQLQNSENKSEKCNKDGDAATRMVIDGQNFNKK